MYCMVNYCLLRKSMMGYLHRRYRTWPKRLLIIPLAFIEAAITCLPMPNTGMPHILSFQKSACHYYGFRLLAVRPLRANLSDTLGYIKFCSHNNYLFSLIELIGPPILNIIISSIKINSSTGIK